MSKTDQAFIDAYRRQAPRAAQVKPTQQATPQRQASHGPHVRFGGGTKAPLSQVIKSRVDAVERVDTPPADTPRSVSIASTQLTRFDWPDVVGELADEHADAFSHVVDAAAQQWPVLGLVGCRPSSGGTTTTMVIARLLAARGMPVALIDADPVATDLTANLGVARHRTLAEALSTGAPLDEVTLHAVDDGVSLLTAGSVTQHPAVVREALHKLRANHAAVLIDLGTDPRQISLPADAVVLVHPCEESDAVIEYSCRSLSQSGVPLVGTIQTMA